MRKLFDSFSLSDGDIGTPKWDRMIKKSLEASKLRQYKSDEEIEAMLEDDASGFEQFVMYFFVDENTHLAPFGYFHKEAVNNLFNGYPMQIWEWHRCSAKSLLACLFIPIWLFCKRQLKGMMIVSNTHTRAKELAKDFLLCIQGNAKIHHHFCKEGVPQVYGSLNHNIVSVNEDFTVSCFGMGQNPQGTRKNFNRPNYFVIDDAEQQTQANNKTTVETQVKYITGTVYACCNPNARNYFIFSNNRTSNTGLVEAFIKWNNKNKKPYLHSKVYLTENPKTHAMLLLDKGGVPAWSENFTKETCEKLIAAAGHRSAMRQYYHQDIPDEFFFHVSEIRYWNMKRMIVPTCGYLYCDPAFSTAKHADNSGVVIVYHDRKNKVCIVADMSIDKQDFCESINRMYNKWSSEYPDVPIVQYIEYIGRTIEIEQRIADYRKGNQNFLVPEFDKSQKTEKEKRIKGLDYYIKSGILGFNETLQDSEVMATMIEEMEKISMPKAHNDGLDALHGAFSQIELGGDGNRVELHQSFVKNNINVFGKAPERKLYQLGRELYR